MPTIIYSPRGKRVVSVSKAVSERVRGGKEETTKRKKKHEKILCIFTNTIVVCLLRAVLRVVYVLRCTWRMHMPKRSATRCVRVCAARLVEWWSYLWTCATAMARREKGSTRWRSQFTRPTNDFATAATNPMNTKLDREFYKYNRCRAAADDVQHTTGPP